MNCSVDSKIIGRVDSIISMPNNHFGESREKRHFGIVLRLTKDDEVGEVV